MEITFRPAAPGDTPGQLTPGEDDRPEEIVVLSPAPVFGAEDDDIDDDEDDDDTADDDDPDEVVEKLAKDADDTKKRKPKPTPPSGGNGKFVPPSEAEWRRVQAALARSNESQRERRQAALQRAKAEGLSEGEAKARADAEETARNTYQPQIVSAHAQLALREAGCKTPARLAKLIDRDAITVVEKPDGSMELVGLEDQVNSLAEDWPELFAGADTDDGKETAPPKPRGKVLDGADRRTTTTQRGGKTATEKALDRLRGGG